MLEIIIIVLIVAGFLAYICGPMPRLSEAIACIAAAVATIVIFIAIQSLLVSGNPVIDFYGLLNLDALSAILAGITSVVSLFVFIYSIGYMRHEVKEGIITENRLGSFYAQMCFFLAAMLTALLATNLVHIWAAIELTTLTSVFLISFYNDTKGVEAAWKFFIINSVGITLALVGILIYFAYTQGDVSTINPLYLKVAFAFVFVGYGTKVGLVPLHVWLPDAHSQAPSPVSALLSGVLLNIALYGILRFYQLISVSPEAVTFASNLLIFFGVLSLMFASLRLFAQENVKRLLAYSSIENMGIMALAFGIGGPLGLFAALFHMVSHSIAKPLAFLLGGITTSAFGTKEIPLIKGAAQVVPIFGLLFLVAVLGVSGSIPFGTFVSEIALLGALLSNGNYLIAVLVILFTTITFGSFLYKGSEMVFGNKPEGVVIHPVSGYMAFAVIALLFLAIFMGITFPTQLLSLIHSASALIPGGS